MRVKELRKDRDVRVDGLPDGYRTMKVRQSLMLPFRPLPTLERPCR